MPRAALVALLLLVPPMAAAQEAPELSESRLRYNADDFDGAIALAAIARADPVFAHAASLVIGRAFLERYRATADPIDLASGREALASVNAEALTLRDRLAWMVGLGQALFLDGQPGAAAEIFETALGQRAVLDPAEAQTLLDWWASTLGQEASAATGPRRSALFDRIRARMAQEVLGAPGSPEANYWLVAAARGTADPERAWDLAAAAWVRSRLAPETVNALRVDLDRLVIDGVVPELARVRQVDPTALVAAWTAFKDLWP